MIARVDRPEIAQKHRSCHTEGCCAANAGEAIDFTFAAYACPYFGSACDAVPVSSLFHNIRMAKYECIPIDRNQSTDLDQSRTAVASVSEPSRTVPRVGRRPIAFHGSASNNLGTISRL